jgi:hypothetical protein
MTKRVYLYAFNNVLEIVDAKFLEDDAISVLNIRRLANWMRDTYPEPVAIYAVDNRRGLHKEYLESVKNEGLYEACGIRGYYQSRRNPDSMMATKKAGPIQGLFLFAWRT